MIDMVEALEKCVVFRHLSTAKITSVAKSARRVQERPGGFFFSQAGPAIGFHVLMTGAVRIVRISSGGHRVILDFVEPVEPFGFAALLADARYQVAAQAVQYSQALIWETSRVNEMMARMPLIAINTLHLVVRRVLEAQDWLPDLATQRVQRRVARALLRLMPSHRRDIRDGRGIYVRITQVDLAHYVGSSPYTVNRYMSRLSRMGIAKSQRGKVVVLRPDRLAAVAEAERV